MAFFNEVKCGRCDRKYSSIRSRCPYCGARKNRDGKDSSSGKNVQNNRLQFIIGVIVFIIIILAVIILVSASLKNREPEGADPSENPGVVSVDGNESAPPSDEPVDTPPPTFVPTDPPATPAPVVNSITLNRDDFTMFKVGETFQMTATLSPAGTEAEIIWISEDDNVVTVDQDGLVTAVDRGTTIVSATAGGITEECIVRVRADAPKKPEVTDNSGSSGSGASSGISLSATDVTIHSSTKEKFTLKVNGTDSTPVYSSNSTCVSVDANGTVEAVSNGTATITVTVPESSGSTVTLECIVRVIS